MGTYKRFKANPTSKTAPVKRELAVVISNRFAGMLHDHGNNIMSFHYDPSYTGPDFSVAMPKSQSLDHFDLAVRPVVEGVLPDNQLTRNNMCKKAGISKNDIFGMLINYGEDLPGAVQICTFDALTSVLAAQGSYDPISNAEIKERLIAASNEQDPAWHGINENWSLGGNQGKFALARINKQWFSCHGAYPSTHIFKPGVTGMSHQALVEFATMQIAQKINLPVAKTYYGTVEGLPTIIIKRYDRAMSNGIIQRIHQEDLCQALGYLPDKKYYPTTRQVITLLQEYSSPASVDRFNDALFFNYLIGGIDAHAKNYSVIHADDGHVELAPLYDLASVLPYKRQTDGKWFTLPMSIGGQTHIGALTGSDIEKHAMKYGFDPDACKQRFTTLATAIPQAIDAVQEKYARIDNMDYVMEEYSRTVKRNCEAALANLDRTHDPSSFVKPGLSVINSGNLERNVKFSQSEASSPKSRPAESPEESVEHTHTEFPSA